MASTLRALLAGFLLTLGAALLPAVPAEAASHAVIIHNYAYGPGALNITQGDTVTWTNHDTAEHDVAVTSGPASFRSPMLSKGESWSFTFTTAGSYSYICSIHPDMRGSVTAKAVAPPPPAPNEEQPDPAQPPAAPPTTPQQTAPAAPAAPTPTVPASTGPAAKKGKHGRQAAATSTPAAVPTAVTPPTAVPPAQPAASLDPLLLVAGVSVAVVVFCLLLMASRPQPVPTQEAPEAQSQQTSRT